MKRKVRLTESDLHRIIKESVKRVLRENAEETWQECALSAQKAMQRGDFKTAIDLCKKASQLYDADIEANVPAEYIPKTEKTHGWLSPDKKSRRVRLMTNGSGKYTFPDPKDGEKKVTYSPMDDFLTDPNNNWPVDKD